MKPLLYFILFALFSYQISFAADVKRLEELFQNNFDAFYQPRFCGRNTAKFIQEAQKRNIDLTGSYVLKIQGAGFFETSAFHSRTSTDERVMLGYFHMVLVADGYVFDFDLNEPLVLKIDDYIRLQFTPPRAPFVVFGVEYKPEVQMSGWTVTSFSTLDYAKGKENQIWSKRLFEFIDIRKILRQRRIR